LAAASPDLPASWPPDASLPVPASLAPVAPHAVPQVVSRHEVRATYAASLLQEAGGVSVPRHGRHALSSAQAEPCEQQAVSMHVLHVASLLMTPQLFELVHDAAHGVVQAVSQMHVLKAFSSATAVAPAVVWQALSHAVVVQPPRHVLSAVHIASLAHAFACVWHAPVWDAVAHASHIACALPACVPDGASFR
jgi:hypothetical protein